MSRFYDLLHRPQGENSANKEPAANGELKDEHTSETNVLTEMSSCLARVLRTDGPNSEDSPETAALRKELATRCVQSTWSPDPSHRLLSSNGSLYSPGREEFRTLRSRLNLVRKKLQLNKILITSPLPEEGKTLVSANLAQAVLWQHKQQILLVDGDMRTPSLHIPLGAPAEPGLSDYLKDEADEYAVIKRGSENNLFFIPAGKPSPNANELIGNGRLKLLLDRLTPVFDWIIVDSPPVILLSDARLMGELCDGVLMVVKAGSTPFDLAQTAFNEFREKRFLGVVLNGAEHTSTYGYNYYHYYEGARGKRSS